MKKIMTKYHGEIDFDLYRDYTVKNIYKILPLREENKDWKKYLEGLLIELNGMDMLQTEVSLVSVVAKLQGLVNVEEHAVFRKVIFDCIDLVKKLPS